MASSIVGPPKPVRGLRLSPRSENKMLGNSIKVCEKHYGKWVQSRQDRLDTLVMATFPKT
jgi:hypothetical protein